MLENEEEAGEVLEIGPGQGQEKVDYSSRERRKRKAMAVATRWSDHPESRKKAPKEKEERLMKKLSRS